MFDSLNHLVYLDRVMKALSRHTIDLIARAVLSGRRGYGRGVDDMADFVAGLMKNRLKAAGVKGAERARSIPRTALSDPPFLALVLDRTEKYLAWNAFAEVTGGGS